MAETCEIIDRYLGISAKGHAHRKRNHIPIQSLDFVIQNDTALDVSAMVFLSNYCNKQDFGDLQSDKINTKTRLTAKKYPETQTDLWSWQRLKQWISTNL